jgi:signal transduction histidine kinase
MRSRSEPEFGTVNGRLDEHCRLVEADPRLAALHARAGGRERGALAVPQIAALARLSQRLQVPISRAAIAADGESDIELWVRAEPLDGGGVSLSVSGWSPQPAYRPQASRASAGHVEDPLRPPADWLWETDASLRITTLSSGLEIFTDEAPAQFVGQPFTALVRFAEGEDGSLAILQAVAERVRFDNQLAVLRTGDGRTVRLSAVPLIDGAGKFAGFRGFAIAEKPPSPDAETQPTALGAGFGERLERALREPIDGIVAQAEGIAAQAGGPLQEAYLGYAADMASAGRHLLSLVDDLMDLRAVERPDFAPAAEAIDLAQMARQAVGLLGPGARARKVRVVAPEEDLALLAIGEYRRVLQILMNLVTNAIRYAPEGSSVEIAASAAAGLASVTVADHGKGIEAADQARIFEKFERVDPSEPGGSGLGLYISRRLARAMGGDISLESAPGKGARFTLSLPARG